MSGANCAAGDLTFEQIRQLLPQRFPLLMVDRVREVEPGKRLVALKLVSGSEIGFLGHFPDKAVFPGILLIEAMAQSLLLLSLLSPQPGPRLRYLGDVNVRLLAPVVPGESVEIEAVLVRQLRQGVMGKVCARVDNHVVASGEIMLGEGQQSTA
jgi:3-hydroxyacyl-[acyl-carrier-protein] dehydratase